MRGRVAGVWLPIALGALPGGLLLLAFALDRSLVDAHEARYATALLLLMIGARVGWAVARRRQRTPIRPSPATMPAAAANARHVSPPAQRASALHVLGEAMRNQAESAPTAQAAAAAVRDMPTALWLDWQTARLHIPLAAFRAWDRAQHAIEMLAAATLARDGHVRQAAVCELGAFDVPEVLRYLLPRVADWVPEVRAEALDACLRMLPRGAIADLACIATEFGDWLSTRTSSEAHRFVAVLQSTLGEPASAAELAKLLADPATPRRRVLLRMAYRDREPDDDLLRALVRDPDERLRADAAVRVVARGGALCVELAEALSRDRHSLVVLAFLRALRVGNLDAAHHDRVLGLCFSPRVKVRAAAAWLMSQNGVDVAAEARRRLAAADRARPPALGLIGSFAMFATEADRTLLRPWLDAGPAALRAATLLVVGGIDVAIARMSAAEGCERRAARRVLQREPRSRWVTEVRALVDAADEQVRRGALQLLTFAPTRRGWEVVPDLLLAILRDPERATRHWWKLEAWCAHNLTRGWLRADAATWLVLATVWREWLTAEPVPGAGANGYPRLRTWIEEVLAARGR